MSTSSLAKNMPPTLDQLIDLFNERKISAEELAKKATPLLLELRQNGIMDVMLNLAEENPERYHISSPHHENLWSDAEAAYDAKIAAELAAKPGLRIKVEEAIRRTEAKCNRAEEQSASV